MLLNIALPLTVISQLRVTLTNPQVVFNTANITVGQAGEDFVGNVEALNDVLIRVESDNTLQNLGTNYNWQMEIHRTGYSGNSPVQVLARRTGSGNRLGGGGQAGGHVSGGLVNQEVTIHPTYFFCARQGPRENIPVRFSLNNLSVLHPTNEAITVVFTVTVIANCN